RGARGRHHARLSGRCEDAGSLHAAQHATAAASCHPGRHPPPLLHAQQHDEREQPLTDRHQWGSVHPQRLQQRPGHLLQRLPVHPPAPSSLWGPPALQAQALPHHPAAVWERHLPRDRGAGAHPRPGARELHPHHRGVSRQAPRGHQLPAATLRHPLPQGQPAAAAAGAAALRPHGQADPGPVPGPARAAAAGRQRLLSHRLLRAAPGGGRERQEEDARQVPAGEGRVGFFRDASLKRGGCSGGGPTSCPLSRTKENGLDRDPLHPEHLSKRPCTMSPAQRYSPSNGLSHPPNGLGHPPAGPPLPQHYRLEDMAMAHHYRDSYRHPDPRELRERQRPAGEPWVSPNMGERGWDPRKERRGEGSEPRMSPSMGERGWDPRKERRGVLRGLSLLRSCLAAVHGTRQEEVIDHRLTDREWAEEWKHLNNVRGVPAPSSVCVCPSIPSVSLIGISSRASSASTAWHSPNPSPGCPRAWGNGAGTPERRGEGSCGG
uniref:CBFA2/RUNX1 partner transcriptional co-repressor 3 n=1 Tax=Ficedula albicollis TaxID=59894 RepID=A0A803VR70_FICAL